MSTVFSMSSSQDEVSLGLARRVVTALEAGDRDEAVRLTTELGRALRRGTGAPAGDAPAGGAPAFTGEHAFTAPAFTAQPDFAAEPAVVPVAQAPAPARSARQVITGALAEIGVACRARIVADYAGARFGQRVESRMLAALRRDERRAWDKNTARPTYVVPALEGRYFQPVRGLLTLSDWPLERRLLGPWSERADHLAATAQLARQLAWLSERDAAVAERLAPVVAEMAASIPGALDGSGVDTARVASAAEAELAPLKERDEPWRREAAARARKLPLDQQLWGTSIGVVAEGEA